jgi:hypothetical protein
MGLNARLRRPARTRVDSLFMNSERARCWSEFPFLVVFDEEDASVEIIAVGTDACPGIGG